MVRKDDQSTGTEPEAKEEPFGEDMPVTGGLDTDFDLEEEYKPEPLIPGGNYRGNVIGVVYEPERSAIAWKIALDGNGGVMSDGETSVDGSHQYFRNFIPKPGDEAEMAKDGRQTKRQTKINMMKRFADGMKINMNSPQIIAESIQNQDWIGLPVICAIVLNEYLGVTRNQINTMVIAEDA
jgi:hypothetical protein